MKKLGLILIALVLALGLMAMPVFAGGNGAVKADIVGPYPGGPLEPVGSVIFNTTGNGNIIAVVNVDALPGLVDWDARVSIQGYGSQIFDNVLTTNANGQGNETLMVDTKDFSAASTIKVEVTLRSQIPGGPNPYYETAALVTISVK